MNAYKWVRSITEENRMTLEPVEGDWGIFYAGSLENNKSCIVIPLDEQEDCNFNSGLLHARTADKEEIGYCIIIEWNHSNDHELASAFVEDLIKTKGFFEDPIRIFKKKKKVWKDFNQNDPENRMFNRLVGLWGELAFVDRNRGTAAYWTGPAATDLDFKFQDAILEIKTTTIKGADELTVSSIWQLDDSGEDLFLALYRIELSSEAGKSVEDMIDSLDKSSMQPRVLESLNSDIEKLGGNLCSLKFAMKEAKVFPVRDGFPRITKSNLKECMKDVSIDRVKRMKYTISVAGLETISENKLINSVLS